MRIVLLALLLAGCAAQPMELRPQPTANQLATPEAVREVTSVAIPTTCKQSQVQHPRVVGLNAKAAWKLTDHALSVANGHIIAGNACIDRMVDAYSPK